MKTIFILKSILILFIFSAAVCFAKEKNYTYELEFGNNKAEKIVQIGGNGDLNITGYKGNKVLISADEDVFEKEEEVNEKAKGLKKIGGGGFQINNDKDENRIVISRSIIGKKIDLDIKVPNNIILRIGAGGFFKPHELKGEAGDLNKHLEKYSSIVNNTENNFLIHVAPDHGENIAGANGIIAGDISIKDLIGTVEVSTVVGNIDLENIQGEVTASSVQGNLKIVFNKLSKENALYFSTVNGEIDITLPKKIAADVIAKTLNGDVYSGFDGEITTENTETGQNDTAGLQNLVSKFFNPNHITSRINGGGQEIYLSTINGNIYIRKGE